MKTWLCAFLGVCICTIQCQAEMYTFVDEKGVLHFSNVPSDSRFVPMNLEKGASGRNYSGQGRRVDPREYEDCIHAEGSRYQVDPSLIKAVIKAESNFDHLAVSQRGAQGLMQLMPGTARDMRVANAFDPRQNIRGGTRYLRKMLDTFNGDMELALAAYNAGPEQVKRSGCIPEFPETVNYVKKVLQNYRRYQRSFNEKGG